MALRGCKVARKGIVMNITKARFKAESQFPEVEFCCDEVRRIQAKWFGKEFLIDLSRTCAPYFAAGHCGQQLGYSRGVMAVSESGVAEGFVPFDLIDIDEGVSP